MNKLEKQKNKDHIKGQTLEEIIISKSMNGWILQVYQQLFNK